MILFIVVYYREGPIYLRYYVIAKLYVTYNA